jgi:hypothetical protein
MTLSRATLRHEQVSATVGSGIKTGYNSFLYADYSKSFAVIRNHSERFGKHKSECCIFATVNTTAAL